MTNATPFDPLDVLRILDAHGVVYIVAGGFAAVIHGAPDPTDNLDIVPQMRADNLERLSQALAVLEAPTAADQMNASAVVQLRTPYGELHIVPEPAGTRGYDDLRRKATREPIARRLRPQVAALQDLIRSMHELGRPNDEERLARLRRVSELTRERTTFQRSDP